jgi:hypothetical protein
MSQLAKAILGTIAVSLTFGAVQLALGRDLARPQDAAGTSATDPAATATATVTVNRAAKADRADAVVGSAPTRTISLRLDALSDTSVVIRLPVAKESDGQARNGSPVPATKSQDRKATVACEPPVSVLTEIAKQLQPGRCIT